MMRLRSVVKRSRPHTSHPQRRRLFLLATGFVARGMEPDEAYNTAVYYVHGAGRGRTWISALTAHDPPNGVSHSHESSRAAIVPSPRHHSAVPGATFEAHGASDLFAALRVE
jgi:hypothetical protein